MQKEKVRIFALARELDMESKDLLTLCRQHGIDVKNQLSTIEPEVRDQIVQLIQQRGRGAASAPATGLGQLPKIPEPIRTLPPTRPPVLPRTAPPQRPASESVPQPPATAPAAPPAAVEVPPVPPVPSAPAVPPAASVQPTPPTPAVPAAPNPVAKAPETPPAAVPAARAPEAPPARTPEAPPQPPAAPRPPEAPPARTPEKPAATQPPPAPEAPRPTLTPRGVPVLGGGSRGDANRDRRNRPLRPTGTVRITPPPPLKTARPPAEEKKPAPAAGPRKLAEIPQELMQNRGEGPIDIKDILNRQQQAQAKITGAAPTVESDIEDEDADRKGKGGHKRPGGVIGRDTRHKDRNARQAKRLEENKGGRGMTALVDLDDSPRARIQKLRVKKKAGPQPRKGKVPIEVPITVRSLSEAIGVRSGELLMKLMGHGLTLNINSNIEPEMAEVLALESGAELDVKRKVDAEQLIAAGGPDNPEDLVLRAPIVTIMGHVDHGKTSLLDRIRETYGIKSNVVSTEAGGITQVIRAWRVEKDGKPITFLDTPGHEAFTKMRARGANVTDIAVIVVAADDGVMPQTEEAISHAKAADVHIVVAINKVDLPSANLKKTEQQLYGLGLIPDTMGGDVPFVYTSAVTGKGIDELLEQLTVVAELAELKANPNKPASGTCLEAYLSEGEGVFATILVRDGTLHRGDVVLCGAAQGRVRAMYDDLGRPIQDAGPSVPVRITGLDEVPNADDPFQVVPELTIAREVAEKRKTRQQEASITRRSPVTLEKLSELEIAELKVILKADFRGSIEAIRAELEKLHHEEVRVRLLHAAIGGITESDVQLALTSPEDTIIVGFNVVPDDRAMALAEERGVQIRQYNIIYKLAEDIRSALEGKLKPREEIIHLGRAVVRDTFKISRVGTIAGCYVTQGTLERSAKVRVIRSGVVVYPPPDRTVGLESLKRFKEDVREVREGFECGLKVAGYDDIKKDDVIEAYRIEQVQRKLS